MFTNVFTLIFIFISLITTGISKTQEHAREVSRQYEQVRAEQQRLDELADELELETIDQSIDSTTSLKQANYEFTAESDNQTAFELLQKNAEVEYDEYDFGIMIQAINQLASNNDYYWAFYLNGEYAQQGAKQTILRAGDQVEFRYEKIQAQ